MKTPHAGLVLTLVVLGAAGACAQAQKPVSFPAAANGQIVFVVPSQNVGCTFTPKGGTPVYKPFDGGPELSCDRIAPKYVRVVLTEKNVRRFDNVGDQGCCDVKNVLPHGARWSQGPFTCDSAESGLTCKRADGRGFFIGRTDIKLQ
jgi:hypothetical protein